MSRFGDYEIDYDESADVLYLFRKNKEYEPIGNLNGNIIVSKDDQTGEVVGYTILHATAWLLNQVNPTQQGGGG